MEYFKLINGDSIPAIVFGPDELGYKPRRKRSKSKIIRFVKKIKKYTFDKQIYIYRISNAIKVGFHSIDYSASYGDGTMIAKAIKRANLDRENMYLITRVSNKAQFSGGGAIENELNKQLSGFDTDYVDLLMFHWPVTGCFENTWKKMIELRDKGFCKAIGVANCNIHHLQRLYEISGEYPIVNQIEMHPLFTQVELREFCKNHGIQVMAYSPTARQDDRLFNPPLIGTLAKKYEKTPTQLVLKWHIQHGVIPVIRSLNCKHQKSDIDIFDFTISDEDMMLIDRININARVRYDPDNCDFHAL